VSRQERVKLVDWESSELTIKTQAELLSLNRTSLYYQAKQIPIEEIKIKHSIDEIYTKYPFYGSRRIKVVLNQLGVKINRKCVQRHMREMAICGICPGPNLSKRQLQNQIYPYLLKDIVITKPNEVWGIDITYIKLQSGWMYLVAILDWYSRYIVSWELEQTLAIDFVLREVSKALEKARPEIVNSDQGSHFTSAQYIELLHAAEVKVSMDSKGRALDNVFTERFWRSLKYEDVYLNDYLSPKQARIGLTRYLHFYNFERPHQSLGYLTPASIHFQNS
jgi:putative transposase